jgi:hypothetical protein
VKAEGRRSGYDDTRPGLEKGLWIYCELHLFCSYINKGEILEFRAWALLSEKISSQLSGISLEFQDVELEFHQNFTTAWKSSEIPVKGD